MENKEPAFENLVDVGAELIKQGAEGRVFKMTFLSRPTIVKERFSKKYRHPQLDFKLTKERVAWEVKSLVKCRTIGIDTPAIYAVDRARNRIFMECVPGPTLKEYLLALKTAEWDPLAPLDSTVLQVASNIGHALGALHTGGIVHGDLTSSNIMLRSPSLSVVIIDFGLSFYSSQPEDKAVDLYVLERALISTHPNSDAFLAAVLAAYAALSLPSSATPSSAIAAQPSAASSISDLVPIVAAESASSSLPLRTTRFKKPSADNSAAAKIEAVLRQLKKVRARGRKRLMVG